MRARLFQAMLIRRRAFERVGPLAEDHATSANIDWMSRARTAGLRTVDIPDVVARRRIHGGNLSIVEGGRKNADLLRVVRAHHNRRRAGAGP
jgi:GT2 family glycosyltransferase